MRLKLINSEFEACRASLHTLITGLDTLDVRFDYFIPSVQYNSVYTNMSRSTYGVVHSELSSDSEQTVSIKNLKVRAHQFFFRTRTKNIHFHAIRFVQNTARNSALTNMCVLVPPRMIFIIQNRKNDFPISALRF